MALYRSFVPKVCRQPLLVSTYPANLVVNFEVAGYSAVKLKAKRFHSIWERAKWSILFCRKWEKKTSIANIITCYRENEQYYEGVSLDHFHKWRPLLHFFVFMLIRPTAFILEQILFWNLLVVPRLERLSSKTKEHFIWPPLWKRSMPLAVNAIRNLYSYGFSRETDVLQCQYGSWSLTNETTRPANFDTKIWISVWTEKWCEQVAGQESSHP